MPCSTSLIAYKGPARWKLPANAEIVGDRTAGWTRCWDDANKAHISTALPTAGRPAGNAPSALKKALDEAEFTEHFDLKVREDLCPVENHGQDGVGHFQFI